VALGLGGAAGGPGSAKFRYEGQAEALSTPGEAVDLRIFAKPTARPYRRMGVALARAQDTDSARRIAAEAAGKLSIVYED
jgi:phosphoribosylglycinamide formyltransferase 2